MTERGSRMALNWISWSHHMMEVLKDIAVCNIADPLTERLISMTATSLAPGAKLVTSTGGTTNSPDLYSIAGSSVTRISNS